MNDKKGNVEMIEAAITIEGKRLTTAQSMTIRVALNNFSLDLHHDGLGDDENGKTLVKSYLKRIDEIQNMLIER